MGRKNKYESHVQPHLTEISEWITEETEGDIARKLGVSQQSFENYKKNYPELQEALQKGTMTLITELRQTLKRKAKGFTYTETRQVIREENGKKIKIMEKYEKYAQPDTGAIHLLLKNLDPNWHNDDMTTIRNKEKQLELDERRVDNNEF